MKSQIFLWLLNLPLVYGQTTEWQRTCGPYSATVRNLAVADGYVLAATDGGMYRSTNNGQDWVSSISYGDVVNLVCRIHKGPRGQLFAGTDRGILVSSNAGQSWYPTGNSWWDIRGIATDSHGQMFAGGWVTGLLTSTDSGRTWQQFGLRGEYCQDIFIDSLDNILVASEFGIYRSTDRGTTWNFNYMGDFYFRDFAPTQSGELFVSTWREGLFKSSDEGATWQGAGLQQRRLETVHVGGFDEIYAGTDEGMYYSNDYGSSWFFIGLAEYYVHSIANGANGELIAGTFDGIFIMSANDTTWHQSNTGLMNNTPGPIVVTSHGTLMVSLGATIYRSTNNGDTWTIPYGPVEGSGGSMAVDHQGNILWGIGGDLIRSSDDGMNWRHISHIGTAEAIAVDRFDHIFLANGENLYRSTNNGQTWTRLRTSAGDDFVSSILITEGGTIFIGIVRYGPSDGELLRSTDNGQSWVSVGAGRIDDAVFSLVFHPSGRILAGTFTKGIFTSDESGSVWTQSNVGLMDHLVNELAVSPSGGIYAGTGLGVYLSTNRGESWNSMNSGLPQNFVPSIATGPTGYVFAGVQNYGLYRIPQPVDSVETPLAFHLFQNYPNPFNSGTTIVIGIPYDAHATLEVYNVLGQRVRTILSEFITRGEHPVFWDAANMPSGPYFYRLQVGNLLQTQKMLLLR